MITALRLHGASAFIASTGCAVLCYQGDAAVDALAADVVAADGVPPLLGVLRVHLPDAITTATVCMTLGRVASRSAGCSAIVAAGGIEAVIGAMTLHVREHFVPRDACHALTALATGEPSCVPRTVAAGGIPTVVQAIVQHGCGCNVAEAAFAALDALGCTHADFIAVGRLGLCLNRLSSATSSANVAARELAFIVPLVDSEQASEALAETTAIPTVIACLTKHAGDVDVVLAAPSVLASAALV